MPNFVSLHPCFKAHPEKIEAAKAVFPHFVEKTSKETENLFYSFTVNVLSCEAYGTPEAGVVDAGGEHRPVAISD
jgi:hypothetical protein